MMTSSIQHGFGEKQWKGVDRMSRTKIDKMGKDPGPITKKIYR